MELEFANLCRERGYSGCINVTFDGMIEFRISKGRDHASCAIRRDDVSKCTDVFILLDAVLEKLEHMMKEREREAKS